MHYSVDVVQSANRVICLPGCRIWPEMLRDSHSSFRQGKKCWVGRVAQFLRTVGLGIDVNFDQQIDEAEVLKALCASYDKVWDGLCRLPRQAMDKAKLATYFAWCDSGAWLRRPAYLFFDFSATVAATCTCMRYRLGSRDLAVEVGRWQDRRPRCQRLCLCGSSCR